MTRTEILSSNVTPWAAENGVPALVYVTLTAKVNGIEYRHDCGHAADGRGTRGEYTRRTDGRDFTWKGLAAVREAGKEIAAKYMLDNPLWAEGAEVQKLVDAAKRLHAQRHELDAEIRKNHSALQAALDKSWNALPPGANLGHDCKDCGRFVLSFEST